MAFSFGTPQTQSSLSFTSTPGKSTFGGGFPLTTTTATTSGFGGFGSTFGTPATSGTVGFGSTFGTPATSSAFGSTFGANTSTAPTFGTAFGTPATSAPSFGGFGSFGTATPAAAAATTTNLFSGFGTAPTTTAAPGFTGFTGFGTPTTSSGFGNFGSTFGLKPATSTAFGGFGTNLTSGLGQTGLLQQQQQQQQQAAPPDINQIVYNSIFNCNVFGDERDTVLAKWNLLQASWGTGKGYYSQTQPPVEYTQQNPYCRFKAIGYSIIPGHDNKEGLSAIILNKKESELKLHKDQLVASLMTVMGNKSNFTVCIHSIRAISDTKTQVLIYVQERSITGSMRNIPANELTSYLLQPTQKQQLLSLGVENVFIHVRPDSDQLKEYLMKPPAGIDIRIWKQAQLDNPDPDKYIPVPLVGFEQLKWRSKCQEKETALHKGFLDQVTKDIVELKRRHAASVAQIAEQKRKLVELQHRVLRILVRQEVIRKAGIALQPEEELLKGQLENMHTQISVPTQFKGRLNELLAQIRMLTQSGQVSNIPERYTMEASVQEDIKQFLRMEQDGINHLVEIINNDLNHLKIIRNGMQQLLHKQ